MSCAELLNDWCAKNCGAKLGRAVFLSQSTGQAWECASNSNSMHDVVVSGHGCHKLTGLGFEATAQLSLRRLYEAHAACSMTRSKGREAVPLMVVGHSSAPKCALCECRGLELIPMPIAHAHAQAH